MHEYLFTETYPYPLLDLLLFVAENAFATLDKDKSLMQ